MYPNSWFLNDKSKKISLVLLIKLYVSLRLFHRTYSLESTKQIPFWEFDIKFMKNLKLLFFNFVFLIFSILLFIANFIHSAHFLKVFSSSPIFHQFLFVFMEFIPYMLLNIHERSSNNILVVLLFCEMFYPPYHCLSTF